MESVDVFPVRHISAYEKTSSYSEPKEIGCFSYDSNRKFHLQDRSKLFFFCRPKIPSDLNTGFPDKFIQRDDLVPERLDALLYCLKGLNDQSQEKYKFDFCTWRGIMTKIICLPYSTNDSWELGATLCNGTIYMEEHKQESNYGNDEKSKRMTYYGYKFESLCTSGWASTDPNSVESISERDDAPCDTNIQFCSVFASKLGPFNIICGGEVDCQYPAEKDGSKYSYAELKTNRIINSFKQNSNFVKYKLLKTWAQSYLAGVRNVIFGFRDDGNLSLMKMAFSGI